VFADNAKVSQAWASAVNASGGINGHPVKMIVLDDGGVPATGLQDAKELVQQDHVMAIVGDSDYADVAWEPYVVSAGVPVVGGTPNEGPAFSSPDWYSVGAGLPALYIAMMASAKENGAHKVGAGYCAEAPACKEANTILQPAGSLAGLGYTSLAVSATAPSYTAPCLTLKGAGADAIYPALNAQTTQRLIDACAQQGYTPKDYNTSTSFASSWLKDNAMNGTVIISTNPVMTDTSNPGVAAFLAAMNKYSPGTSTNPEFSYLAFYPWIAGELFEAAAKAANIGPTSTPADVKKGLYALKNETLGGLAPPLTYTKGKPSLITCFYTDKIANGQLIAENGDKPSCLSAAQGAVAKKFG
jgi:branched-chain amino acid transport system substrate-binding protein